MSKRSVQIHGDSDGVRNVTRVESNGGLAVNLQDQTSRALDLFFVKTLAAPGTLDEEVAAGDLTIEVTTTTGFADGVMVLMVDGEGHFYQGRQIGAVAGNTVTLDTPVDRVFTVALSAVFPTSTELNVNGSVTTQIFQIGPVGETIVVDITRIMGYMLTSTAMDDAKFGNLTALTNGLVLRINNGVMTNIWNMKSNGELGLLCFDTNYSSKAPAGQFGFRFRATYAGQDKHGVTLRLEAGDTLELLIQDDLSTLDLFTMMAQGHVVTD